MHCTLEVEEMKDRAPNVLTFELITAEVCRFAAGCYIPPSIILLLDQSRGAFQHMPEGSQLLVLGNLNVNLSVEFNKRDATVADFVDGENLVDLSRMCLCQVGAGWTRRM